MRHVISRTAVAILAATTLVACGSNNEEKQNNAANNATTGSTGEQTTAQTNSETNNEDNNAENNGTTNIGTATLGPTTGPAEPAITVFEYYLQVDSFGNTGYTFTVASQRIANSDGYDQPVSAEDADEFVQAHLTAETIDAMLEGWGCSDAPNATSRTFFGARIRIDGSVTRYTQDVTGCVADDDRTVVDIVEALDTLGAIYL